MISKKENSARGAERVIDKHEDERVGSPSQVNSFFRARLHGDYCFWNIRSIRRHEDSCPGR